MLTLNVEITKMVFTKHLIYFQLNFGLTLIHALLLINFWIKTDKKVDKKFLKDEDECFNQPFSRHRVIDI